jgi:hypothetical protein
VFDINVPIGLVVSVLSIKYISSTTDRRTYDHKHLDIFGAVSVTAGLMLLVYSLNIAQNIGIGSLQTLGLLLLSVIVLAAFLLIEYRSKAPLMPLGFLRRSSIFEANIVGLLQVAASVGMIFILTNYFQQILNYSALSAGFAFVPIGVVFLVVSGFFSAPLVNRFGVKPILITGMTLQTIGYLLLSSISINESYFGLLGPMLLNGLGTGLGFTAINIAAFTGTRRGEEGLGSGLINTSRQIGGPIGLALLLTIANFEAPHQTGQVIQSAMAVITGFDYALLGAALLTGIGVIFAALLKQQKHRQVESDNAL